VRRPLVDLASAGTPSPKSCKTPGSPLVNPCHAQRDHPAHGQAAGRVAGASAAYPPTPDPPRGGSGNIGSPAFPTRGPDIRLQPFPQIKVRDLSHTSVSIAPADYSSWHDVRTELMAEAKTGFKARVEAELAAGELQPLDAALNLTTNPIPYPTSRRREPFRAQGRLPAGRHCRSQPSSGHPLPPHSLPYSTTTRLQEERAIEHEIDHTVHTFSASVDVSYNVRRLPPVEPVPRTHPLALTAPFSRGSSSRTRRASASNGRALRCRPVDVVSF
jgi:hypothetical protein